MRRVFFCLAAIVAFGLMAVSGAWAAEEILSFHSRIVVNEDATVDVTETIRVRAEGVEIRRGIYRDFPTTYKDRLGNRVRVDFDVREVLRDGKASPYHTESISGGVRVYIGASDVYLDSGEYTYTIRYRTDRQIGYFDDYDELYWNATGDQWSFPILRAEAVLVPPKGAPVLSTAAYTGARGETGRDFTTRTNENGNMVFTATRRLNPGEGMTIAVAWPKGFVHEPGTGEKLMRWARDNLGAGLGLLGFLAALAYFLWAWARVGRDPAKGTIIPLFGPPNNLSPAAVRFIKRMGYDDTCLSSAVINLAVKQYLTIEEEDGEYVLNRTGRDIGPDLSGGEKAVVLELFKDGDSLKLEKDNRSRIQNAINRLKKHLRAEYGKEYFRTNGKQIIIGALISLCALALVVLFGPQKALAGFLCLWLSIWSLGTVMLTGLEIRAWKAAGRGDKEARSEAVKMTLFALPFQVAEIVALGVFVFAVSILGAAIVAAIVAMNLIFIELMKAPTRGGRKVLDKIDGFLMYLKTAEEDRLESMHPPDMTPELFERFLPYALALGVENTWSERFAAHMEGAGLDMESNSPSWYRGAAWSTLGVAGFAGGLSNGFNSAVSSAVTVASSGGGSSGGFGGGFSGGGGGGGGGGGW